MMFAQLQYKINFTLPPRQAVGAVDAVYAAKGQNGRYNMPGLQKKMPQRIVIYAKDVENITGRKARTARSLLSRIREQNQKQPDAFVTVKEFCLYTGIPEAEVREFLLD